MNSNKLVFSLHGRSKTTAGKILVVEDETDILNIVKAYLERWGFAVDGFSDPLEALEHFKENAASYSIVLSDIGMPGMTGLELAIEMRKIKPEIKFVLMTAFDLSPEDLHSTMPVIRYDDLIHKPFKLVEICTA